MMGIMPYVAAGLLAAFGSLGLYAKHLHGEVAERDALLTAQKKTITGLEADVLGWSMTSASLKKANDVANTRLSTTIAENNASVDREVERRRQVEADRNEAREALRIALDTISTVSETDDEFKTWLGQPVPRAAWDRLRDAAE